MVLPGEIGDAVYELARTLTFPGVLSKLKPDMCRIAIRFREVCRRGRSVGRRASIVVIGVMC